MKPTAVDPTTKPSRQRRPPRRAGLVPPSPEAAPPALGPGHEQRVREAAYFIYERSGRVAGRELENWLEAEALLLREETRAGQNDVPTG